MFEIKSRFTGEVLFRSEKAASVREALVEAISAGADLADAYLAGAYLAGARERERRAGKLAKLLDAADRLGAENTPNGVRFSEVLASGEFGTIVRELTLS